MNRIETIRVALGTRTYSIFLGRDWLGRCGSAITGSTNARRFFLLSVRPVHRLYGARLEAALRRLGPMKTHLMPDGEAAKNERTLLSVLRAMAAFGLQRDSCLVALGGGVVGDLGGLASALYMRGIDVIQCPTTLLAQVDAGIGGKTAIDFEGVKNLVGAFHQPRAVLLDTSVLDSLTPRLYRSGLAEVVKHGIIRDAEFFGWMEEHVESILAHEPSAVHHMLRLSCRIKVRVVEADERESGIRAILNFGHTLGHALEAASGRWGMQHGEAVAYGMWGAALLSWRMGLCGPEVPERIGGLLRSLGLLGALPPFPERRFWDKLSLDKKGKAGKTQFVLTRKIGVVSIHSNVPKTLIGWALRRFRDPKLDLSGHS